jgi:ribose 5-phosphate isomerase A
MSEQQRETTHAGGVSAATQTEWKRQAARRAVQGIPEGAVLGLGSGTTAEIMVAELAQRVRTGLRVTCVATSERTATVAAGMGLTLIALDDAPTLTMSIDGADEVSLPALDLVKGRGGALLREKLVAASSRYRVIIADVTKLVSSLASTQPIPVEVVPFGWRHTAERLAALGARPVLRMLPGATGAASSPFVTDGGHYILDCAFGALTQPGIMAERIKALPGVIDHGLFIGMTERVLAGGPDGVHVYERQR